MKAIDNIVSIAVAIVGVAIVAVLVSNRSKTSDMIQQASAAFNSAVRVVVKPIS